MANRQLHGGFGIGHPGADHPGDQFQVRQGLGVHGESEPSSVDRLGGSPVRARYWHG